MSSSLRRGALAAAAIAFSIASLAACGAGNNAQTLEVKPDNAATAVGVIKIQNALVVTQPNLQATGPAVIAATVFNNGSTAQTLDSITVDGTGASAQITPAKGKGKLTIPAHGSVIIGGAGNASAVLSSTPAAVKDGNAQAITFTFSSTGDVGLRAFVVPAEGYFDKWGPSKVPTAPSQSPATPSGSPSKTPSGTATRGSGGGDAVGTDTGASASPSASEDSSGH